MQAMATDKREKANKSLSKIQYWWMRWNNRIEDLAFYFCNEHCVFLENNIRNKKTVLSFIIIRYDVSQFPIILKKIQMEKASEKYHKGILEIQQVLS